MPNQLDTKIDVLACVEPLRRLEVLGQEMTQPSWLTRDREECESKQAEFVRLQELLPPPVVMLLRTKISTAKRLVAPIRRAKCTACNMSIPRGDHGTVLAGHKPVICQHCGVLLYADEDERAAAGLPKSR